ncbi:hypothetical protein H0E87_025504 [Populus deltoides]|uniref:Uncharacterized protein n=1 Tax=Populus deltoides TaxID=3696 RepID=A0A8T2WZ40_POPDE|nr:hypothetical protein H0E87_025504 [Populus deltoides]
MLSKGFGDDEAYQETLRELRGLKGPYDLELRNSESRGYDDASFQRRWKTEKSVLIGVDVLARQLRSLELKKRWGTINEVWVEMVAYAAAHCPWKEHTQQLRRGGELLTHVSLLMLHLGLSEQYEYKRLGEVIYYLKEEEYKEYRKAERKYVRGIGARSMYELEENHEARDNYLEGIAAMSGSSPDEFEILERMATDTEHDLERKKREHERKEQVLKVLDREELVLEREERVLEYNKREVDQLSSYLTASVPQQGIDSLPRSLPAQSDDEISLII